MNFVIALFIEVLLLRVTESELPEEEYPMALPWMTVPSGDMISKASSAANLTAPRNLLVRSKNDMAVEEVKLCAPFWIPLKSLKHLVTIHVD